MLQFINDKLKGWVTWIIIIAVSLVFVLTGISYFFVSGAGGLASETVAKVGEIDISKKAYQNVLQQNVRNNAGNSTQLQQKVLQQLINQALLRQDAENAGIHITPQMLSDAIFSDPTFQDNGEYSAQRFDQIAKYNGGSAAIKSFFVNNLLATSIIKAIGQSQFVLNSENKTFKDLLNQSRQINYYRFKFDDYTSNIKVNDAQLKAYYEEHQSMFHQPEQAIVSYVTLSAKDFIDNTPISSSKIQEYYTRNQSVLMTTEQRQGQLIKIKKDAKDKQSIINTLKADLPLSASQQNEVTVTPIPAMTVDQAKTYSDFKLFALTKVLSTAEITQNEYVQMTKIIPAKAMSLDEATPVIEKILRNRTGVEHFNMLMTSITNNSFEQLVKQHKLQVKTSKAFSNGENGDGIEGNFKLQQAIFEHQKPEGFIAEDQSTGFIYKLDKTISARVLDFKEVKDKVKQAYVAQQSDKIAKEHAEKLQQTLKAGKTPKGSPKLEQKTISRAEYGIDQAFKNSVFRAGLNAYQVVKNGHAYWVFAVTELTPGQRNMPNSMLENFYTSIETFDYINALHTEIPVQINHQLIDE